MKTRKKTTVAPMSKVKNLVSATMNGKIDKKKRWMISGILLYIISPIDIIPDFLPIAGYADDIVLPILLIVAENLISSHAETKKDSDRKDVTPQNQ